MSPQCCIITIGDELLMGQTIDTNSAWLAKGLNELGIRVRHRVAVGDDAKDIREALDTALTWANVVIITGGLGPTADDITKPLLCDYFGGRLVEDEAVLNHVTDFFTRRGRPMLERNRAQAMVPDVCNVLFNNVGTAPGMLFKQGEQLIASLPGVPFEMKFLFTKRLRPILQERWPVAPLLHRYLLTAGEGESFVAERLVAFEEGLPAGIKLAYLPDLSLVKLRLSAEAHLADELIEAFDALKNLLKSILVYEGDFRPEEMIHRLFTSHGIQLAIAESCTGGHIAARLTSVSGSSAYFSGGFVPYATEAKHKVVGVSNAILENHTAVSAETAEALATLTCARFKSDYALSVTGYLEQGDHDNSVWIGLCGNEQVLCKKIIAPYDREKNTQLVVNTALTMLYKWVSKVEAHRLT
jgi:nicotinamide-nucleotide amidase